MRRCLCEDRVRVREPLETVFCGPFIQKREKSNNREYFWGFIIEKKYLLLEKKEKESQLFLLTFLIYMYISQHAKGHNTLFPTRGEREKTTFLLSSSLLVVLFFLSSLVSSSFFARLIENRKCISSRIIIPSFREGFFSPSFNKTSLMRETRNRERNYDSQSVSLPRRRRRRRGK